MSKDVTSDQICVVIHRRYRSSKDPDLIVQEEQSAAQLYNAIWSELHPVIWNDFSNHQIALDRIQEDIAWVELMGNGVGIVVFVYQLSSTEPITRADQINDQLIHITDRINDRLIHPGEQPLHEMITVAFPNRSAKGAPIDSDGGGPGCPPKAVPQSAIDAYYGVNPAGEFGQFTFLNETLQDVLCGAHNDNDVVVAILDTWPEDPARRSDTDRVTMLSAQDKRIKEAKDLLIKRALDYPTEVVRPPLASIRSDLDAMPSHGLFVAGIIRSIAPEVPIYVVRVLDDKTSGDIRSVLSGLAQVQAWGLFQPDKLLILNLSLYFNDPARQETTLAGETAGSLVERFFLRSTLVSQPHLTPWDSEKLRGLITVRDFYGIFVEFLFRHLTSHPNVFIAAAAGNDRPERYAPLPAETAPASYGDGHLARSFPPSCAIVGVAAVSGDASPNTSSFTNRGDIATLGGDIEETVAEKKLAGLPYAFKDLTPQADGGKYDAIVGYDGESPTGWSYWAGTSFATAIVSGVAAGLATHDPALAHSPATPLTATGLRNRLFGYCPGTVLRSPAPGSSQIPWLAVKQAQ